MQSGQSKGQNSCYNYNEIRKSHVHVVHTYIQFLILLGNTRFILGQDKAKHPSEHHICQIWLLTLKTNTVEARFDNNILNVLKLFIAFKRPVTYNYAGTNRTRAAKNYPLLGEVKWWYYCDYTDWLFLIHEVCPVTFTDSLLVFFVGFGFLLNPT